MKHLLAADNSKERFKREVDALKKFSHRNERYIIKLLATYEIDGSFWLLFPVADGNLLSFWKKNDARDVPNAARWLAEECYGLATALQKIHKVTSSSGDMNSLMRPSQKRMYGIHGDIKPENILWFKTLPSHLLNKTSNGLPRFTDSVAGFLQISDFGTVDFHRNISREGQQIYVREATYGAPESDLDGGSYGSQKIDVWSLGCLYLEFITWYFEGISGIETFADARLEEEPQVEDMVSVDKFFIKKTHWMTGREKYLVKPSVSEVRKPNNRHPISSIKFQEANILVVDTETT